MMGRVQFPEFHTYTQPCLKLLQLRNSAPHDIAKEMLNVNLIFLPNYCELVRYLCKLHLCLVTLHSTTKESTTINTKTLKGISLLCASEGTWKNFDQKDVRNNNGQNMRSFMLSKGSTGKCFALL